LIRQGCRGFLASVIDVKGTNIKTKTIVINEHPDVFPEDLLRLPPDQKVEFAIDLLPSTASISKAPYRMALTKMKELKIQGFVRQGIHSTKYINLGGTCIAY